MPIHKCLVGVAGLVLPLVAVAPVVSVAKAGIIGRIAYVTSEKNIYVMDLATGTTHLVPIPTMPIVDDPQWSPDGQWLTFNGGAGLNSQIYVVRPDGSGFRQITNGAGDLVTATFSPDGTRIAYNQVYGHIYTSDSNSDHGTPAPTQLPVQGGMPRWSPGPQIAYSNWGFTYDSDVFVYDPATGINTQVTHHNPGEAFNWSSWSPDGTKLALSRLDKNSGYYDICVSTWDGSSWSTPVDLTSDWTNSSEEVPTWSPDGKCIAFTSNRSGNWDIWYMPVNDPTNRVDLTNTSGIDESGPAWSGPSVSTVPEPSALVLCTGLGTMGLVVARRRGKRTA